MKVVGLITEYNPFHNGHLYHIKKAKEVTGASHVVVIMSGDFVQRGEPAIVNKYIRTKMALQNGADVVLELPVLFSTASAAYFAFGAAAILEQLGSIDFLCFGSEEGNLLPFQKAASILLKEEHSYKKQLKKQLKNGISYPKARQNAIHSLDAAEDFFTLPNNILGIEYVKALEQLNSSITPVTIKRIQSGYHDTLLDSCGISSATAIRSAIEQGETFSKLTQQLPNNCLTCLKEAYQYCFPVYLQDFSVLLYYQLLYSDKEKLISYFDMTEELANRIDHLLPSYTTYKEFCIQLKSKQITYTRIQRCLLHILLQISKEDITAVKDQNIPLDTMLYARLLGFRKEKQEVIRLIKKNTAIPIITKTANAKQLLSAYAYSIFQKDITASQLYRQAAMQKFHSVLKNEYTHGLVLL